MSNLADSFRNNAMSINVKMQPVGPRGKNLEYAWNGTQLGVRAEGGLEYSYVDLKGEKGDKPILGVDYTVTNGKDGTNGIDGVDGTNGKDGEDGITPIKDTDYRDGIDGIDGTNGIDGIDGEGTTYVAGENITIVGNVISATGGGGTTPVEVELDTLGCPLGINSYVPIACTPAYRASAPKTNVQGMGAFSAFDLFDMEVAMVEEGDVVINIYKSYQKNGIDYLHITQNKITINADSGRIYYNNLIMFSPLGDIVDIQLAKMMGGTSFDADVDWASYKNSLYHYSESYDTAGDGPDLIKNHREEWGDAKLPEYTPAYDVDGNIISCSLANPIFNIAQGIEILIETPTDLYEGRIWILKAGV